MSKEKGREERKRKKGRKDGKGRKSNFRVY